MRSLIVSLIGIAAAALGAEVAATPPQRVPQPGYKCRLDERGDFGLIEGDLTIADAGNRFSGYIRWDAGDGQFRNPWITAAFFRNREGAFTLGNGYVNITRHIWDRRHGKHPHPLKLRLELTTEPASTFASARLAGAFERSGGPFSLQLNWSDAASLGAGADTLYLVARDPSLLVVDQIEIDRTVFRRAEPRIRAAFATAERMIAHPGEACTRTDDINDGDIVVT